MVQVPFYILRLYRHNDYYVEICADQEFEAWLYHKNCGIKMFMFGLAFDSISLDDFVATVERNIAEDIAFYEEEFCDWR